MWLPLILTLAMAFGLARIMVQLQSKEITENWNKYRCDPQVMMFAGFFKSTDDPRSFFDFTSDNFSYCSSEIAKSALNIALKPIYGVFFQLTHSATQSIGFTMNLRTLASNMFHGLTRMFDVFNRRFNLTLHELHKSYIRQFNALQKAHAIANAAVYTGISIVQSIMNFIKLIVIIVISICVILVVLTIFFFYLVAPVVPLTIAALAVAGAFGGSVGSMADAFCFEENTPIILKNGESKNISKINIGDILLNDSVVTSVMKFQSDSKTDIRNLDGIHVSGSHIVYDPVKTSLVKEHKMATKINTCEKILYCLNTSDHKIPVRGVTKTWYFADWEEIDNKNMLDWDKLVYKMINPHTIYHESDEYALKSESGFSEDTPILCLINSEQKYKNIRDVSIGDIIKDNNGWTKVVGTVATHSSQIVQTGLINGITGSCANWIYNNNGVWKRASQIENWRTINNNNILFSLFTESGTFTINNMNIRDFSEVGLHNINSTYEFTLSRL